MHRYCPICIVEINGNCTSNGLYDQKNSRNNSKVSQPIAVFRFEFMCYYSIDENGYSDDADKKTVEPFHEYFECCVTMIWSTTVNLVWIFFPVCSLFGFIDHESPCSKAFRPIWTRFACIMDTNCPPHDNDEQCHHHESEGERRWPLPPRLVHVQP